jgi:hypothetical protein
MKWTEHIACGGDEKFLQNIGGKPEGKMWEQMGRK